ncbi:MAG: Tim44 domain-containing protein [Rubrivivax sp.]|nr:Tim44 domain-containing protein [Rubrivivax sp.]
MKIWTKGAIVAIAVGVAAALASADADARRLGGGKSLGTQRSMPERTAPSQTPPTQAPQSPGAAPGQQVAPAGAPAAAAAAAPGAAAAAGKRSWMGPIAGLAAGLGLAALMSHLGLGEAFANFLMLALLAVAVIALAMFIRRRMAGGGARPALAGAGAAGNASSSARVAWPSPTAPAGASPAPLQRQAEPAFDSAPRASTGAAASAPLAPAFVPAAFDSESFERIAKAIFIRMQAANDAANLDDLRQFTTPQMFAELKVDILERGKAPQATEVKSIEARVIDVAEEAERQVVSVRYRGEVVEAPGAAPEKFDEVWHLVRPRGSEGGWAIAGIEQMPG